MSSQPVELRQTANEIIAVDGRGHSVSVGVDGWQSKPVPTSPLSEGHGSFDQFGSVRRLTLPDAYTVVYRGMEATHASGRDAPLVRTPSPVRIRVDSTVGVEVHVLDTDGDVALSTAGERNVVGFRNRGLVGLSFHSENPDDRPVVRVPRTLDGIARALSTVHRTTTTTSPNRSFPNVRSAPARLLWGTSEEIPESFRNVGSDVTVRVPPSVDRLVAAAPLAQYLGATVEIGGDDSRVIADGETFPRSALASGERGLQRALQTVFWLDCLARCAGTHEPEPLSRLPLLDTLGLDAEWLFEQPMSVRVRVYLERLLAGQVPLTEFPEWHYGISVEPTFDRLPALVDTLERLPIVRTVESPHEAHEPPTVLDHTEHTALDTDVVEPESDLGRTHAWLADGVPAGGLKLLPAAFENRPEPTTDLTVVVVDNHDDDVEAAQVRPLYRGLSRGTTVSTELRQNLEVDELAAVIREEADHLHFVGHCDDAGLGCAGNERLPVETVSVTRLSSFVLNACDSVEESKELVRRGAVAGVATTRQVITGPARDAGRECARLLANGWPVAQAISRAEAAVVDGETGYVTVGDGTYAITSTDALIPPTVEISTVTDGYQFRVCFDQPVRVGATQYLGLGDQPWLVGDGRTTTVGRERLKKLLTDLESPVVFEGEFRWPENVEL